MYATQDDRCPIAAYKLFASKRPSGYCQPGSPFYIAPRTRALTGPDCQWFVMQRVGLNKLGHMVQRMAEQCGLDRQRLTNHSVRKRMVQMLRDENVAPTDIMQFTGHKNIQSVLNYSAISESTQKAGSHILSGKRRFPVTATVTSPPSPSRFEKHDDHDVAPSLTSSAFKEPTSEPRTVNIPNIDVHSFPTHSEQNHVSVSTSMNLLQTHSQFYGAVFNVNNFNFYTK
jgi:hypothetical protein